MFDENSINIYTDGSSFSSPRRGGVGMRFVILNETGCEEVEDWSPLGYQSGTNNQMELKACILALREARRRGLTSRFARIVIHTDSMYVCDNYKNAIFHWPKQHWFRRSGAPVLNAPLWKELVREIKASRCRVDFCWVKGHAKDYHNKAADKLAKQSAQSPLRKPALSRVSVRRKKSAASIELGSVGLTGQRLSVRVISCEWPSIQRLWKLKYEIISRASPYYGKIDLIYSDILIKDGHSYYVRVNNDTANPRIVKVFREIS
jgi:ribonuclease HI